MNKSPLERIIYRGSMLGNSAVAERVKAHQRQAAAPAKLEAAQAKRACREARNLRNLEASKR